MPLRRSSSTAGSTPSIAGGRTTQKSGEPSRTQGAGASVRVPSTKAAPTPAPWTAQIIWRRAAVFPAERGPAHSVTCPRGTPPRRAASSSGQPNGQERAPASRSALARVSDPTIS